MSLEKERKHLVLFLKFFFIKKATLSGPVCLMLQKTETNVGTDKPF